MWGFVICYLNIKNEALNFMKWCPGKRVAFVFAIPIQSELWTTGMGVKVRWPYTVHRQSVGLFCPVRSVKTKQSQADIHIHYNSMRAGRLAWAWNKALHMLHTNEIYCRHTTQFSALPTESASRVGSPFATEISPHPYEIYIGYIASCVFFCALVVVFVVFLCHAL